MFILAQPQQQQNTRSCSYVLCFAGPFYGGHPCSGVPSSGFLTSCVEVGSKAYLLLIGKDLKRIVWLVFVCVLSAVVSLLCQDELQSSVRLTVKMRGSGLHPFPPVNESKLPHQPPASFRQNSGHVACCSCHQSPDNAHIETFDMAYFLRALNWMESYCGRIRDVDSGMCVQRQPASTSSSL